MPYDQPQEISYDFNAQAFGGGTITKYIQGPKGKRGRVAQILATPTVAFVGTTTPGAVQLGVLGALTKFANVPMGTAATPAPVNVPIVASDYVGGLTGMQLASSTTPPFAYAYAPADTPIIVTLLAPTGGAPAGTADVVIKVEWF